MARAKRYRVRYPRVLFEDDEAAFHWILAAQRQILLLDDRPAWHAGRLKAIAEVLANLSQAVGETSTRATFKRLLPKRSLPATTHCCWHGLTHGSLRVKPSSVAGLSWARGTDGIMAAAKTDSNLDVGSATAGDPSKAPAMKESGLDAVPKTPLPAPGASKSIRPRSIG